MLAPLPPEYVRVTDSRIESGGGSDEHHTDEDGGGDGRGGEISDREPVTSDGGERDRGWSGTRSRYPRGRRTCPERRHQGRRARAPRNDRVLRRPHQPIPPPRVSARPADHPPVRIRGPVRACDGHTYDARLQQGCAPRRWVQGMEGAGVAHRAGLSERMPTLGALR